MTAPLLIQLRAGGDMTKSPADTKLVISARLRFTLWRVPEELAGRSAGSAGRR